jgi:hypothetical protein
LEGLAIYTSFGIFPSHLAIYYLPILIRGFCQYKECQK